MIATARKRHLPPDDPFGPTVLAADLLEIVSHLQQFFAAVPATAWDRRTERRGWTLHETLAHLSAVADDMQTAVEQTLQGLPVQLPGISHRTDLPAFNARAIDARRHIAPQVLSDALATTLQRAARCAAGLTPAQLAFPVHLPVYSLPLTVELLLGTHLVHSGMAHAAQIAVGAGVEPLWRRYRPSLLRRQLQRVFALMPAIYWPERGGALRATFSFIIDGPGGGQWYVQAAPTGASGGEGPAERADVRVWAASPDTFCRVTTLWTNPALALLRGEFRVRGNVRLAARMGTLFTPT